MKSRAEKLLEGFKLGDLGAGKKNYSDTPEPPKAKFKILEEGSEETNGEELPYTIWQDPDGMNYALFVGHVQTGGVCHVHFRGGERLRIGTGWRLFKHAPLASFTQRAFPYDAAVQTYESYVHLIKQNRQGIEGLLDHLYSLFEPGTTNEPEYLKWLKAKRKGKDDPIF